MAHDVFISYAKNDREVADAICAGLEDQGIPCSIAPRNLVAGEDWGPEIVDAIRASRALVLVYSSSANRSEHVKREVDRAVFYHVPPITFRIEDAPMSGSLGTAA